MDCTLADTPSPKHVFVSYCRKDEVVCDTLYYDLLTLYSWSMHSQEMLDQRLVEMVGSSRMETSFNSLLLFKFFHCIIRIDFVQLKDTT